MRQGSLTFQRIFNQQWVDQQLQRLQQLQIQILPSLFGLAQVAIQQILIQSINNRRRTLDSYARNGFFDLEQPLIDAFTGAGFLWGGQWQHEKDFMHFEIP
jgi:hypothetical protein